VLVPESEADGAKPIGDEKPEDVAVPGVAQAAVVDRSESKRGDRGQRSHGGGSRNVEDFADGKPEITEKVVHINRCAKVVKGGRRFSFSALVVCGDKQGNVGYGTGKANEVSECIRKASEASKRSMRPVTLRENTIPHEVIGEFGGGRVLLRPACPGTGIIAGGSVRAVVEAAGIKDILAKSMGSSNHGNVVKATMKALESLRSKDEIFRSRGKGTAKPDSL
jgi:small subunit ribosomal protein S5